MTNIISLTVPESQESEAVWLEILAHSTHEITVKLSADAPTTSRFNDSTRKEVSTPKFMGLLAGFSYSYAFRLRASVSHKFLDWGPQVFTRSTGPFHMATQNMTFCSPNIGVLKQSGYTQDWSHHLFKPNLESDIPLLLPLGQ